MIAGDAFRARVEGLADARCTFDGGEIRLEWTGMEDREDILQTALDAVVVYGRLRRMQLPDVVDRFVERDRDRAPRTDGSRARASSPPLTAHGTR